MIAHDRLHPRVGGQAGAMAGVERRGPVDQFACGVVDGAALGLGVIPALHHVKAADDDVRRVPIDLTIPVQYVQYAAQQLADSLNTPENVEMKKKDAALDKLLSWEN